MSYTTIGDRLDERKYEPLLVEAALYAAQLEEGPEIVFDLEFIHPLAKNTYEQLKEHMRAAPIEMIQVFDAMAEGRDFTDILQMPEGVSAPAHFSVIENGKALAECLYQSAALAETPNDAKKLTVRPEKRAAAMKYAMDKHRLDLAGKKPTSREKRAVVKEAGAEFDRRFGKGTVKNVKEYGKLLAENAKKYGPEKGMLSEVRRINKLAEKSAVTMQRTGRRAAILEARMAAGHQLSTRELKTLDKCNETLARVSDEHRTMMELRADTLKKYLQRDGEKMDATYRDFVETLISQTEMPAPDTSLAQHQTREVAAPTTKNEFNVFDREYPRNISTGSRFFDAVQRMHEERDARLYKEQAQRELPKKDEPRKSLNLKERGIDLNKDKGARTSMSLDDSDRTLNSPTVTHSERDEVGG